MSDHLAATLMVLLPKPPKRTVYFSRHGGLVVRKNNSPYYTPFSRVILNVRRTWEMTQYWLMPHLKLVL